VYNYRLLCGFNVLFFRPLLSFSYENTAGTPTAQRQVSFVQTESGYSGYDVVK